MIVGAGKLGVKLAEAMTVENMDVTLVDSDAKVIENTLSMKKRSKIHVIFCIE